MADAPPIVPPGTGPGGIAPGLAPRALIDPRLGRLWRRLWTVPERLSVSQFAERYRVVSETESARPGPYSCGITPHMREPMDAVSLPEVREVTFAGCTQIAKTDGLIVNVLCWAGRQYPGPGLFVGSTKEFVADVVRTRLRPALRGLKGEATRESLVTDPEETEADGGHALLIEMPRMNLWAVGTESLAGLKSRPIKFLLKTEVEDFAPGAEEQLEKRQATYRDRKTINDGNPGLESGPQWQNYLRGDRRRWNVPCPHCGRYQELTFDRLRWGEDGTESKGLSCTEAVVKATVRYICIRCGVEILPEHRWGMLQRGVWVPEGCAAEDGTGKLSGEPTGPGWPTHRSYTMGHLASPFVEWWEVAWGFIRQKGRPSAIWVNSVLGLPYTPPGEELKKDIVKRRFVPVASGGFWANAVPRWARCLVGGIDVQHDGYWVLVEAYGFRALRSLVIDAAFVKAGKDEPVATYEALRRILATRYRLDGGPSHPAWGLVGDSGMPVSQYLMDTGDGPRTADMYGLIRRLGHGNFGAFLEAAKGVDTLGVSPYNETVAERDVSIEDRKEKVSMKLTRVSNWYWKEEIAGHLLSREDERSAGEAHDFVKRMLLPQWDEHEGWMEKFCEHVTNERRVAERKKGGKIELRWMPRYHNAPNHLFDCLMLSRCCAEVLHLERRCWGAYGECAVGPGCEKCG